jgi:hypothetical protein
MIPIPQPQTQRQGTISVTAVLDESFVLLRGSVRLCFGIVAVLVLPLGLLAAFLGGKIAPDTSAHLQRLTTMTNQIQSGGTVADATLMHAFAAVVRDLLKLAAVEGSIALVQYGLISCALAFAVCARYLRQETSIGACYRLAARRLAGVLAALFSLVALLLVICVAPAAAAAVAGFAALASVLLAGSLIAALYLGVRLSPLVQVAAIEGLGTAALRRSYALTRRYFWKALGLLVLTGLTVLLMISLADALLTRVAAGNNLATVLVNLAITAATVPVVLCTQTLFYLHLRRQQEEYPRESLAAALQARGACRLGQGGANQLLYVLHAL